MGKYDYPGNLKALKACVAAEIKKLSGGDPQAIKPGVGGAATAKPPRPNEK